MSKDSSEGSRSSAASGRPEGGREVRWSPRRKAEVVQRLLRGEGLDALARETGQAAGTIAGWREDFLQAGHEGLKARPGADRGPPARRRAAQDRRAVDGPRHPQDAQRGDGPPPSVAEALNVTRRLEAPLVRVCRVAGVSRSAACEQRRRRSLSEPTAPSSSRRRPGPVGALADGELLAAIRREIADSPFVGEGHKKLRARLALRGIHTSGKRVLRLTREAGLLAPTPQVRKRSKRLHDGTITVTDPDTLWATDATEAHTRQQGRCAVFAIVDHASGEAWLDASPRMDRWAAADLLREVCTERFGSVDEAVCAGLALRYDGGPCFRSDHYQAEIDFLGIARSPAYHHEPETNGCVEKFIQTLKEQVLWIERFDTLEQLRARIRQFARDFNERWLLERHGYRTPTQARETLRQAAMA